MFSLELVSQIQAGSSVISPFQPYWELLIDYSLTGFLLTVLLGLAGVTLTATSDIACLPVLNGTYFTDLNVVLFVNSRCSRKFDGSFLLYYPYVALLAYLILLFGHLLSVKLPSTNSFLTLMFHLFGEFKNLRKSSSFFGVTGATNPQEQQYNNDAKKGGKIYKMLKLEAKEQVIALVERLISALKQSSGFFIAYVAKSVVLLAGSILVIAGNIIILHMYDWSLVFNCDIAAFVPSSYDVTSCTIPAAPFLYGLMVISSLFSAFIFLLTLRAIIWLIHTRNYQTKYLESWGKDKHILSNLPGFPDFCFCLMLMKHNGSDGYNVYKTVNSSLKIYVSLKIQQFFENNQLLGTSVASDVQLKRDNYICDYMLKEIGLVSHEMGDGSSLMTTLQTILNNLKIEKNVRKMIHYEFVSQPALYKDMIDTSPGNLSFREYVKSIIDGTFESGEVTECMYILMAFANRAKIKLVLLRPKKNSLVFLPLGAGKDKLSVVFLKHIPPNDFVSVTDIENVTSEQQSQCEQFLHNEQYPKDLQQKAVLSWKTDGYRKYLKSLKDRLPKYLTGTNEVDRVQEIDQVDSGIISAGNRPAAKSHLKFLEELGLVEDEDKTA